MAPWGWIAGGYGVFLTFAAIGLRGVAKRPIAIAACLAYTLVACGAATLGDFWVHVLVPGALSLVGYWLSGFFLREPQPWLERWLLDSDRRVFDRLQLDQALEAAPLWLLNLLELGYSTVYIVVMAGAFIVATLGRDAVVHYWTIVLPAEVVCCAALPFLRSRPPRTLERPGVIERRAPLLRTFNTAIVNNASIKANTIPSAHVAAALAAALGVTSWFPVAGVVLIGVTLLIATAATLGRYHYAIDCALGAVVALVLWLAI